MAYYETYLWLKQQRFDLALLSTSTADAAGDYSLAMAADFSPAALVNAKRVVLHANPELAVTNAPKIPAQRADFLVRQAIPLVDYAADPAPNAADTFARIAAHIAELIGDGAVIQLGLGKLQSAVLGALTQHRNLSIHSGMISTPLVALAEAGALAAGTRFKPAIRCGVALGDARLRKFVSERGQTVGASGLQFASVGDTHKLVHLAALQQFIAVNSVLEVDLFGQANGEWLGASAVSGAGGMVDFLRGARLSQGGLGIVALPARSKDGRSRIVAKLAMPASIARADIDVVVTEYGIANLRHTTQQQRVDALLAIAAPEHRDELAQQFDALHRTKGAARE